MTIRARMTMAALSIVTLVAAPLPHSATAGESIDRLPDLAMARPVELSLSSSADGRRRLRFTSSIVNIGEGPFETRASRASVRQASMTVKQRIYNAKGDYRVVPTRAIATYSGDGHDHWHVQRVATYTLFDAGDPDLPIARSSKVGFCFFDTRPFRLTLVHAAPTRRFSQSGCGTRTSYSLRHGISVGWADRYGAELRYQAVDVTGLPAGDYLLQVTADPNGYFLERSDSNNCNWTRIHLPATGAGVTVLEWGAGCQLPITAPTPAPTPTPTMTPMPTPTPTPQPAGGPT
jgi:hypothetical protein